MKVVSVNRQRLNLAHSLLHELDGVDLNESVVDIDGTIVLNEKMQILPLISAFLCERQTKNKNADTTAKTYGRNLSYILSYLSKRSEFKHFELDQHFLTVSRAVLEDYFSSLQSDGIEDSTIRNRDASLKAFFDEFLCKTTSERPALRDDNPYCEGGFMTPSPKKNIVKPCDIIDLEQLMLSSKYERERLILQFIFDSGVRRSELGRINLSDIQEALRFTESQLWGVSKDQAISPSGYIPIIIAGSKGKSRQIKPRVAVVSIATLNRIKAYHASPLYKKYARKYDYRRHPELTPAFLNSHGERINAKSIDNLLEKLSNKALANGRILKLISPHKLRHGYAYEVLNSKDFGDDYLDRLVNVSKTLGHSKIETTQNTYTRIPVDIYQKMLDKDGEVLTKAKKMELLTKRTKIKILIGDRK
ncbi:tyrosine-type recombinase/integrase [Vibrio sp. SA48]|uniref:tyrosine-type recombinase/integrase n=1 Tax=Vibrio sp. S12_S33 TaxID=2720223 RepID=UPI00177EF9CA|nr:tyrosine-type recombinase/integrase [Vibrio sp. S12_S33]